MNFVTYNLLTCHTFVYLVPNAIIMFILWIATTVSWEILLVPDETQHSLLTQVKFDSPRQHRFGQH